jgi:hypothetical protein
MKKKNGKIVIEKILQLLLKNKTKARNSENEN